MTYSPPNPAPPVPPAAPSNTILPDERKKRESDQVAAKIRQGGVGFPGAGLQRHLLIVRANIARIDGNLPQSVKDGLAKLGALLKAIDDGTKTIDVINDVKDQFFTGDAGETGPVRLNDPKFVFSATVGFGRGFFDLLAVPTAIRPRGIREMPDHVGLGDPTPYSLGQTDLIIQIGSTDDFINRWVLENSVQPDDGEKTPPDIVRAMAGWATISDVHAGFQRTDGRNLQGFNDGVSNPNRLSDLFESIVYTQGEEPQVFNQNGTYMVFQKIVHDLDQWRSLDVDEQEEWVGRSKATGLLLGTLPDEKDKDLGERLKSLDPIKQKAARDEWHGLFDPESDPTTRFFDGAAAGNQFKDIKGRCPAWAHVRKANPRQADGVPQKLIFRRGYPFMESGMDHKTRSGLLFISFGKELDTFQFVKSQWFGNGGFPTPGVRPFSDAEITTRQRFGRYTVDQLNAIKGNPNDRALLGLSADADFQAKLDEAGEPPTQQTGREGLAGPSELGVTPTGEFLAIMPLGGGYYFVPPIPAGDISKIGQPYLTL